MPTLDRPRFSLRDLMIFVVLVGIYLAGDLPEYQKFGASFLIIFVGSGCVYLAVDFYYRDLSRWMWLVIATILMRPLAQLIGIDHFSKPFIVGNSNLFYVVTMTIQTFLPIVAIIMVYRDIRRHLRDYQNQIRQLTAPPERLATSKEPPAPTALARS